MTESVTVTARGTRPHYRGGHHWDHAARTVSIEPDVLARLEADPEIVVEHVEHPAPAGKSGGKGKGGANPPETPDS